MRNVFISGLKGNMGQRYASICQKLGYKVTGCDKTASFMEQAYFCKKKAIDRVIIATPTETHLDAIEIFKQLTNAYMLVEKPLARNHLTDLGDKVTMVNQYEYLVSENCIGPSSYNYFKSGSDGLFWDCINIIGLAKGNVSIKNDSPIWRTMINGRRLNISDMDLAYIDMVRDWLQEPRPNQNYYIKAHDKVIDMIETFEKEKISKAKVVPIFGS